MSEPLPQPLLDILSRCPIAKTDELSSDQKRYLDIAMKMKLVEEGTIYDPEVEG